MALSCSTQILQRSWLAYFRQGTWCLTSCATNAAFRRSRAFTSSSSSYILRSQPHIPQHSLPIWRQRHSSSPFQFQNVRALSSSSLEIAPEAADQLPKVLKEEEEVASTVDEYVDSAVEEQIESVIKEDVQEALKSSQEKQINSVVAQEDEVQEALSGVDLLDDEGSSEFVEGEDTVIEERHPWTEWDKFLNMLEVGGHFVFETETTDRRAFVRQEDDSGRIKRASMAFARNRDDVIKYAFLPDSWFALQFLGFPNAVR